MQLRRLSSMGLVRLKIREMAAEKGWTLKEVAERSGVIYSTVKSYARRSEMSMVDFTAIYKLARTFDVMIEDLVEILEE
jgi:transcriptional regulator with XRE-family HTH domain